MAESNETVLFHDVAGDPQGPAVVLLHPLGGDRVFWSGMLRHLDPGLRAVVPDLRGAGRSPDLDRPLVLDRTAEDVEALRRHLGLGRIVIAGCAIGAMAAARYAARYPEATRALVMANPGYRIGPDAARNLAGRADKVRAGGMEALLPDAVANAFVGFEGTEAMLGYTDRFLSLRPENYALSALGAAESDISGDLAGLTCPVLLVPGGNDRLLPRAQHADRIAEALREARLVEFEQGAHFIPCQQPAAFAEALARFVRETPPASRVRA